ncbi:hypothetical protein, partial [Proteus mirabilis]|uniref:hypothetical protein n=1 Tax=Proteus mirabilis TaxID=584 RepID=UPI00195359FB
SLGSSIALAMGSGKNCMEINFQQCITIANFLINESSISVEYNAINSMVSPVIEECNFENLE